MAGGATSGGDRTSGRTVPRLLRPFVAGIAFVNRIPRFVFAAFISASLVALVVFFAPALREWTLAVWPAPARSAQPAGREFEKETARLTTRVRSLEKQFGALTPSRPYLIVDTSNNRITLMSGKKVLHKGICSTGSYVLLKAGDERQWVFKTPRGRFYVQQKEESPVWHKPDWAFIEEGLPVPPRGAPERYETGVLGDYALHLGDGYLVHGTLYKRLLGMPVTHGCVRLDDEDLSIVYKNLSVGSAVFMY
jgi:L,D-transpeptidase YbiS